MTSPAALNSQMGQHSPNTTGILLRNKSHPSLIEMLVPYTRAYWTHQNQQLHKEPANQTAPVAIISDSSAPKVKTARIDKRRGSGCFRSRESSQKKPNIRNMMPGCFIRTRIRTN